jgi:PAS domain S-box-containing protein
MRMSPETSEPYPAAEIDDERRLRLEAERRADEERSAAETLDRIARALNAHLDLDTIVQRVTDEATALAGAQFGAFFYNVLNDAGGSYTLYTLSGVPREAFAKFPMPRNTAIFAPTFNGEGIVRLDDVTQDPRYGKNAPYSGMPPGHLPVRSYLAVPVVARSGEVLGGLFFGHERPAVFDARVERLVGGVAAHTAIAIENARLFGQARRQEALERRRARHASLAGEVGAALTRERTLESVLQRTCESIVRHLDAAFARVWVADDAREVLLLRASAGLYTHLNGGHARVRVGELKIGRIAQERHPHLTNDVLHDPRVGDREWAQREGLVAFAGYPLVVGDDLVGVIALFARAPLEDDVIGALAAVSDSLAVAVERDHAERARQASEQQLRLLVDGLPELAWTARPDGFIDFYNARWYEYTGTTFEQMQGWGWRTVHDPALLESVTERWTHSLATGEPFEMEFPLRGRDGAFRWFLTRVRPLRDPGGRIVRWFGMNTDIHEQREARKRTEALLAEVAQQARSMEEAITSMRSAQETAERRASELEAELAKVRDR